MLRLKQATIKQNLKCSHSKYYNEGVDVFVNSARPLPAHTDCFTLMHFLQATQSFQDEQNLHACKPNRASVYCQVSVVSRRAASSVDGITDYNGFCVPLSRCAVPHASGVTRC